MSKLYVFPVLVAFFIAGTMTTSHASLSIILITITIITLSIFAIKNRRCKNISILALFYLLGIFANISSTNNHSDIKCNSYICQIENVAPLTGKIVEYLGNKITVPNTVEKVKIKLVNNQQIPKFGDIIFVKGSPRKIKCIHNPYAFDYKEFLNSQDIYYQHTITNYCTISNNASYLERYVNHIREQIHKRLVTNISNQNVKGIVSAMLLGIKTDLTKDIKKIYSDVGVSHIFAVSGLHVGIICAILLFIFSSILGKRHKITILGVILGLWIYAYITALSPSVVRATLMGSILLITRLFNRDISVQTTIALSALILVILNTQIVHNIGFQLSYMAVIGIVIFQKPIYDLIHINNKILNFFWNITCVTVAVQITTLPLTLYYFQKFPTHFIISNLIMVPISAYIVGLSILTIIFSFIPWGYELISLLLEKVVNTVNICMRYIHLMPYSSIQNIAFDKYDVILLYIIVLFLALYLDNKKYINVIYCFAILMASKICYDDYSASRQRHLIIYDMKPYWALSYIKGNKCIIAMDKRVESMSQQIENQILPSLNHYKVYNKEYHYYDSGVQCLTIDKKKFIILNTASIIIPPDQQYDYVLINYYPNKKDIPNGKCFVTNDNLPIID